MLLIVVSPHHSPPTPLKIDLGTHTLLITNECITSDDVAPVPDTEGSPPETLVLDNEEAYKLCMCLQALFRHNSQ